MSSEVCAKARQRDVRHDSLGKSLLALQPTYEKVQRVSESGREDGMADMSSVAAVEDIFKLGQRFRDEGAFEEAALLLEQASEGFARVLGAGHQLTLASQSVLGSAFQESEQHVKAQDVFKSVLKGCVRQSGKKSLAAAGAANNYAASLAAAGSAAEAIPVFEEAMQTLEIVEGAQSLNYATVAINYASCLKSVSRAPEALQVALVALGTIINLQGYGTKLVASAAVFAALILEECGLPEQAGFKANILASASQEFFMKTYGKDHPFTTRCQQLVKRLKDTTEEEMANRRSMYGLGEFGLMKMKQQEEAKLPFSSNSAVVVDQAAVDAVKRQLKLEM